MKQRLVKGFLVLVLLCFLPGMMFCKGPVSYTHLTLPTT